MWKDRIVEEFPHLLYGVGTFCGWHRPDHELAERIGGGDIIVYGIVENGSDIAEVYGTRILRWLKLHQEPVESCKPVLADLLERELSSLQVELYDTLIGGLIDFPCALLLPRFHIVLVADKEKTTILFRIQQVDDFVLNLHSSHLRQFTV